MGLFYSTAEPTRCGSTVEMCIAGVQSVCRLYIIVSLMCDRQTDTEPVVHCCNVSPT